MLFKQAKQRKDHALSDSRIYADFNQLVALQNQIGSFASAATPLTHSMLTGRYSARQRGRGLDFEELRHYRVGDDIRSMDWKVTNRTRKPHVRVYTEERERPLLLLVDQRQSMFFGSQEKMKSVVAAEVAALLGWQLLAAGDCVGAVVFNDSDLVETRPRRSRNTVLRILQQCVDMNHLLAVGKNKSNAGTAGEDRLNHVLTLAQRLCSHDYCIVLISDLSGWNELSVRHIKSLARHNDLHINLIYDPLEKTLPAERQLVVSDGDLQIAVAARRGGLQQQYTERFVNDVEHLQQQLGKYAVSVTTIDTVAPLQQQIRRLTGKPATATR